MVRALRRRRKRYARRSFPIKAATEEHRLVCHLEQLTSGRTDAREHREPQANGLLSFDAREARYPRRRADGPRPCFHQGSHGSALSPRQSALHGLLDRLPPRVRSRVTDGADESLPPFQRTCRVPGRALARARTGAYHPATRGGIELRALPPAARRAVQRAHPLQPGCEVDSDLDIRRHRDPLLGRRKRTRSGSAAEPWRDRPRRDWLRHSCQIPRAGPALEAPLLDPDSHPRITRLDSP